MKATTEVKMLRTAVVALVSALGWVANNFHKERDARLDSEAALRDYSNQIVQIFRHSINLDPTE